MGLLVRGMIGPIWAIQVTTVGDGRLALHHTAAVRDELKSNKALPLDLEARLFAYFDELSARRKRRKKSEGGAPKV